MFTQALFTQAYFNMTVTDVKVHSPCECTGGGKCGYGEVRCACGGGVVQCADECGVCVWSVSALVMASVTVVR